MIYGYVEHVAYYEFHSLAVVCPRSVCVLVKFRKSDLNNFAQLCGAEIVLDDFGRLFLVVLYDFDDVYDRIVEKFGKYRLFSYLTYIVVLQIVKVMSERSLFAANRIYEILGKVGFVVLYIEKLIYLHVKQIAYDKRHIFAVVCPRSVRVLVKFRKRNLSNRPYGQITRFLFKEPNLIRRVQKFLYVYIEYNV